MDHVLHRQPRGLLPHGEEGVSGELEDVAIVREDLLDHGADVAVQDLREARGTATSDVCVVLAKVGETLSETTCLFLLQIRTNGYFS